MIKARAATSDTRDRNRHRSDIAQLAAIIDDPIELCDSLDNKEKRYLVRVRLPDDPTKSPWLELGDETRQRAVNAWLTLVGE